MKIVIILIALLLIVGGGYLLFASNKPSGQPSVTQEALPGENIVTLTANGFMPQTLTIKAGQTVTWKNQSGIDGAVYSVPHPIHNAYPPLNLGTFTDGGTLSLTFSTPGTYGYHNHLNPSQTGTIVVQ